jgi:2-haloacid dehalogenase
MTTLDLNRFEVLTFDCYGTLIDWEAGILAEVQPILAGHDIALTDDEVLERYARFESAIEGGPYRRYRDVLAASLVGMAADLGIGLTPDDLAAFSTSVPRWPPFVDSVAALQRLAARYRLGVITNCDDDFFAASARRLETTFEWVVTAQQVGAYKPSLAGFERALAEIDVPREHILHVAQSLFHDHVPAGQMGLATAWVNRRHDRPGFGATPPAEATPDLVVPDLATFAELAVGPAQ